MLTTYRLESHGAQTHGYAHNTFQLQRQKLSRRLRKKSLSEDISHFKLGDEHTCGAGADYGYRFDRFLGLKIHFVLTKSFAQILYQVNFAIEAEVTHRQEFGLPRDSSLRERMSPLRGG